MNQTDLQTMAEERFKDAKVLLDAGRWEFAYYAVGYVVECALKSCVLARMTHTAWVFEEKWNAKECLTHDLAILVKLAGLDVQLNDNIKVHSAGAGQFHLNWAVAKTWAVTSRYEAKTENEAKALFAAIADEPDGVLRWIRTYW